MRKIKIAQLFVAAVFCLYLAVPDASAQMPAPPTTAAEGMVRARAEGIKAEAAYITAGAQMVTAVAQAGKTAAEARMAHEKYRSLAMDNTVKVATTYYERRMARETYLANHVRSRPTAEDVGRYARSGLTKRLGQISLVSYGNSRLLWPAALMEPEFDDHRTQVEDQFARQSLRNSGVGSELYREVNDLTSRMQSELKASIRRMSPTEYMAAKRYLESLAYETRFTQHASGSATAFIR